MLLFIDTETTGLIDFNLDLVHPSQPRLVELAAYLAEDDAACTHVASLNAVIKPDNWGINVEATNVHGITNAYAAAFGEPIADVLNRFGALVRQAEDAEPAQSRLIGHNIQFDTRIVLSEFVRADIATHTYQFMLPFCTMRALTQRMKLPSRWPRQYKWPTLDEAYHFCFDCAIPLGDSERHRAMVDLLAAKDVFCHGRREGWWT